MAGREGHPGLRVDIAESAAHPVLPNLHAGIHQDPGLGFRRRSDQGEGQDRSDQREQKVSQSPQ